MDNYYFDHIKDEEINENGSSAQKRTNNRQEQKGTQKNTYHNEHQNKEKREKGKENKKGVFFRTLCCCIIACLVGAFFLKGDISPHIPIEDIPEEHTVGEKPNKKVDETAEYTEELEEPSTKIQDRLDSDYLDYSDIVNLSDYEIQLLINTIYAKHGRVFVIKENIEYFKKQEWYIPIDNKTDEEIVSEFNIYERNNVDLLSSQLK